MSDFNGPTPMTEEQKRRPHKPHPLNALPVVESLDFASLTAEQRALADELARSGSVGGSVDLDPAPVDRTTADLRAKKGPQGARQVLRVSTELIRRFGCVGMSNEEMACILGARLGDVRRQMETDPATGSQTPFALAYHRGLAALKQSIRRKQIQMAMRGNFTLLIWLGKQLLGQREQMVTVTPANGIDPTAPRKITISVITPIAPMTVPKGGSNGGGNGNGNGSRSIAQNGGAPEEAQESDSHDGAN